MAGEIASLFVKLGLDAKEFQTGIKGVGSSVDKANSQLSGVGAKASLAFAGAGAAAGAFAVGSVQQFAGFEQKMNEVFTLLPGISKDAMGKMTDDVLAFSNETGKLPDDVIPAVYQALSAGVPQDNVFEFLRTANKAAVGGVTSLEDSVNGLSSAVNAYGPDVLSAESASDTFFTTIRLGKTTFPELSAAMSQVAPAAAALNIPLTDVSAALATMTSQGEPTASAATKIKGAVLELSKSGSAADKAFQKVAGTTFPDFINSGGTLQDALGLLKDGADEAGTGIQNSFGSVEAGMAAVMLTSASGEKTFSNNMEQMASSAGATGKAFDTMSGGIQQQANKLVAGVKTATLKVGQFLSTSGLGPIFTAFGPALGKGLGAAIGGVGGFLIPKATTMLGKVFAAGASGLGGLGAKLAKPLTDGLSTALTGVVSKLATNSALMTGMDKVGGMMGSRIGTALKGAAALGLAGLAIEMLPALMEQWDQIRVKLEGIGKSTSETAGKSTEEILAAVANLRKVPESFDPLKRGIFELSAALPFALGDAKNTWGRSLSELEGELRSRGVDVEAALVDLGTGSAAAVTGTATLTPDAIDRATEATTSAIDDGAADVASSFDQYVTKFDEGGAELVMAGQQLATFDPDLETWALGDDFAAASADTQAGIQKWIAAQSGAVKAGASDLAESMEKFRGTVVEKLGVIQDAFDVGVDTKKRKNVSGAKRLKQMADDIDTITKRMHESIKANDPVNTAYWENALIDATGKYDTAKANIHVDAATISSDLAAAGVSTNASWLGIGQSAQQGKNKVNAAAEAVNFHPAVTNVQTAADAMRESMSQAGHSASTVAPGIRSYIPFIGTAAEAAANAIANPITGLNAYHWGTELGSDLVAGMRIGNHTISSQAAHWANLISNKLGFNSPAPREGPLHKVPNWGPHMIEAWIGPMLRHGMKRVPAAASKLAAYMTSLGRAAVERNGIGDPAIAEPGRPRHRRFDRAANPDLGERSRETSVGDTYNFHIGTLVANDAGIDELYRRMETRLKRRTRGGRRLVGAF